MLTSWVLRNEAPCSLAECHLATGCWLRPAQCSRGALRRAGKGPQMPERISAARRPSSETSNTILQNEPRPKMRRPRKASMGVCELARKLKQSAGRRFAESSWVDVPRRCLAPNEACEDAASFGREALKKSQRYLEPCLGSFRPRTHPLLLEVKPLVV